MRMPWGISVVLGTPTYAVPPWLRAMDPDLAGEKATGVRHPWGWRQEVDITHPPVRKHAEGVIRAIAARYANHPAIIGYQVDNEPGPFLLHNQRVFDGFLVWLEGRYGDVETLNREWGLTFWSQRIRSWDELWRADGNHSPQYQLEWRRYQAELVTDFIAWQARIVREYANPRQFVTTCISYERPAIDDRQLVQGLDVTAGNPYYMMQEALHIGVEVPRTALWWTTGVWALYGRATACSAQHRPRSWSPRRTRSPSGSRTGSTTRRTRARSRLRASRWWPAALG